MSATTEMTPLETETLRRLVHLHEMFDGVVDEYADTVKWTGALLERGELDKHDLETLAQWLNFLDELGTFFAVPA